ncbi:carbohydrate ABC transporter permease [Bacillota bacterium Meth-B3]|nr:sugar ABC transporter permease [Christensenellaceae bacterium]
MQEKKFMRLMTLPALLIFLFMGVYPTLQAIINSLTSYNMTSTDPRAFIWFDNYIHMVTEVRFWEALGRTAVFVLLSVTLSCGIGLMIAVLLNKVDKLRNTYRIIYLMPMVIAPTITALNFKFMYNYNFGIINHILNSFNAASMDFLGNPAISLYSCMAVDVWLGTPLAILVLLAGLEAQPESLYEAGMIDGANRFQIFRHITLPLLRKFAIIVIMLRTMDALKAYEVIQLLTTGGPGTSSETLNIYISKVGFSWFEMGYASALGIFTLYFIMFLIKFVLDKAKIFQAEEAKA